MTGVAGKGGGARLLATCLGPAALVALSAACGVGDPAGSREPAPRATELVIEAAPAGLEQAVVVDSAAWQPTGVLPAGDGAVDIEGPYRIHFRNAAAQDLVLRYELRFYDEDGFLVDRFIPFGQPLRLAAGRTAVQEGTFEIRAAPATEARSLRTMRVAARLALPG